MAAIENATPQISSQASRIGTPGGRGRRGGRSHGSGGRGRGGIGGGVNERPEQSEAIINALLHQDTQQQQHQQQQLQQQSGRQRRHNRPRGESHAAEGSSSAPSGTQNSQDQGQAGPSNTPPSRQRHRRGRGGAPGTRDEGSHNTLQLATEQQHQGLNWQQQLLLENSQHQFQQNRNQGGGGRGGRGNGRQGGRNRQQQQSNLGAPVQQAAAHHERPVRGRNIPARSFGTQLTTEEPAPTALCVEATPFEPGQSAGDNGLSSEEQSESVPTQRIPAQIRPAKTVKEAEDLMTRIHTGLASGSYECMICYGGVTRKSQIWDCGRCYAVFHLKCIQKWAKQGLEAPLPANALQNGEERRTWRCPGCQNPAEEAPSLYECWCGKLQNPEVQRYIAPHSCGQTCGKQRLSPRACPHTCDLQCHAGPCPPCTAMGPVQACYCGKESTQRRCLDTDYENGWSCQQICEDFMPCGEHTCPRPCHPGMCGDCEFEEELKCYCGKICKGVRCCDKGTPITSTLIAENGVEEWMGHWSCKTKCERSFDCGKHTCQKQCHPMDVKPAHCPLSPDVVTKCPCGKTKLTEILDTLRKSCGDPVPSCKKACNKVLKCGHQCEETCHIGDCGPCLQTVQITCRCGRTSAVSMCHQGEDYDRPQCMRTCKVMLNCQRHECGEKCCSGETAAMERIAAAKKKKSRPLNAAPTRTEEVYEPEHICTRPCGKLLKCGTHHCPMLCHRGPCGTCLEASFEELACHCGKTVIQPPVPCGSQPPACTHPCTRPTTCSHPRVPHNCHGGSEPCPKCPYLTVKKCLCGKNDIKNQPCWRDTVTCGTICGKKLSCGSHSCKKICHKPGECEEPCTQPCGKTKTCAHSCTDPCHAPFQCTESTPCQSKIQISCACGGIKQETKCNATKANASSKTKEIKCNDACRLRRMALALEIDPDRDVHQMGYSDETIELYHEHMRAFTQSIEKTLRAFAEAPQKRYAFAPMKSAQRQFIHSLAEDFGLESESQDPEPYRSVVVMKGPKFIAAPKKTIAQFIQTSLKTSATHTPSTNPLIEQLRKPGKQASNAIVLSGLRVGLLMTELEKDLEPVLRSSQLRFNIHWTSDDEVVLEPKASSFGMDEVELELSNIKPAVKRVVATKGIAQEVDLCWVGRDGKVVHKEGQKWAVVGNNKLTNSFSSPSLVPASVWGRPTGISIAQNGFSALDPSSGSTARGIVVLGTSRSAESLKKEKRKKIEVPVVDNWEEAADEDEEEEARSAPQSEAGDMAVREVTMNPAVPARAKGEGTVENNSDSDGGVLIGDNTLSTA